MSPYLEAEPLEFDDFSGGETDNFVQGDPKRYYRAQNFLITVDKKLQVRDGTIIYDPVAYTLPNASGRVTSLLTMINETILIAHSDRKLYTQTPDSSYGNAFAEIQGPTGNEALGGGDNYSQLTTGEFQHQLYYTTDALVQPGKIFRDQNNAWKALTAGVPQMQWQYDSDATLLAKCCNLANAIRQSMISHFTDAANGGQNVATPLFQHAYTDKWSLSYLQTVTWSGSDPENPGPKPIPIPAPAASTQTTLFSLCKALSLSYEHHRNDLAGPTPSTTGQGNYKLHFQVLVQPNIAVTQGTVPTELGINAKLSLSGIVTTTAAAAAFLDELAQKWFWHQLSPISHSPTNVYAMMSKYLVTAPKIGTVYSTFYTVQVTPNYQDFIAFANWLTYAYNLHVSNNSQNGVGHFQTDFSWTQVTLPQPWDFDSAALNIFWCRYLYGQFHQPDSTGASFTNIKFSATGGSAGITSVIGKTSGSAVTLPVGSWVHATSALFNDADVPSQNSARVTASGSGTATLSKTLQNSGTLIVAQTTFGSSLGHPWWHGYCEIPSSFVNDGATDNAFITETLTTGNGVIGTDLTSWLGLGTEFLTCLGSHESNTLTHFNGGALVNDLSLNDVAQVPLSPVDGNPFHIPVVQSLSWALFYLYQYTVEPTGLIYQNNGHPDFSLSIETCATFPVNTVLTSQNSAYYADALIVQQNPCATVTGIPTLGNDTTTNYDTTVSVAPVPTTGWTQDLTVELYRTTDGGTTFYYVTSLTNGTASYTDLTNDLYPNGGETFLNTRQDLYTSGGVVPDDSPPQCKYMHYFAGYMYYGAILDTGQYFPQRIRQSKPRAPDSAPATFFDDLEDELVGLTSTRTNLLALCTKSVYRITGAFDITGNGAMVHEGVGDEIGALNTKSIVKTEIGVFFAGTDGFYYTDGFQLIKISLDLDKTYAAFTASKNQKDRIYGCYDKLKRRVWWAMQSTPTQSDNDTFFIFYLDYGTKPSGVFTRALTTNSWMPASAVFYKRKLIVGDSRGYLFKSDPWTKTDPTIASGSPSTWGVSYIPWWYRSCALDFGTIFKRKWVTKIHATGENVGNASVQINSINDNNTMPNGASGTQPLAPIQYTKNYTWGDPTLVWGSAAISWKYDGTMDVWRRFPSGSMRSDFKQIEYLPGKFVIYRSDSYPAFCFATSSGSTVTIATPSGYSAIVWPKDARGMTIAFDKDNYATQYPITAVSTNTLTVTGTPGATGARWQITGYRTQNSIKMTSFVVHFSYLGDKNEAYQGDSSADGLGTNA